jgi:hypothetical protein
LLRFRQPVESTRFPREIHRQLAALARSQERVAWKRFSRTAKRDFRPLQCQIGISLIWHKQSGSPLIEKRSLGGSCDLRLNPSRSSVPEFEPRGRGQLPDSSKLAGYLYRCRTRSERFQKSPASHTALRRFVFYSTRSGKGARLGKLCAKYCKSDQVPRVRGNRLARLPLRHLEDGMTFYWQRTNCVLPLLITSDRILTIKPEAASHPFRSLIRNSVDAKRR